MAKDFHLLWLWVGFATCEMRRVTEASIVTELEKDQDPVRCSDYSGPTTQPNIDIVHTGIENLSVPVLFLLGKDQGSVLIG